MTLQVIYEISYLDWIFYWLNTGWIVPDAVGRKSVGAAIRFFLRRRCPRWDMVGI